MLAAHDDKRNPGAGVASPTMPWGWGLLTVDKKDKRSAPYHLVWPRDLYQVATAQIAAGRHRRPPTAKLDFLLARRSGRTATSRRTCRSTAARSGPASRWTSRRSRSCSPGSSQRFDAADLAQAAPHRRVHRPPRARSPSRSAGRTRAATRRGRSPPRSPGSCAPPTSRAATATTADADRYERVADRWAAAVQRWTATTNGPYSDAALLPADHQGPRSRTAARATAIGDGGPARADQRKVVDPSFLELVRLGVKRHDDPVILNTLGDRRPAAEGRDAERPVLAPLHLRRLRRARERRPVGARRRRARRQTFGRAVADLRGRARRVRAARRPARGRLPERRSPTPATTAA